MEKHEKLLSRERCLTSCVNAELNDERTALPNYLPSIITTNRLFNNLEGIYCPFFHVFWSWVIHFHIKHPSQVVVLSFGDSKPASVNDFTFQKLAYFKL